MIRILVFSDTHRNIKDAVKVVENMVGVNAIIHLGDVVYDALELRRTFKDIPVYFIAGNNDMLTDYPTEDVICFGRKRIFICHGHTYNDSRLADTAIKNGCTLALRGHTHQSCDYMYENVRILNPGSISRPRDGQKSYAVIEIEDKELSACIVPIQSFN